VTASTSEDHEARFGALAEPMLAQTGVTRSTMMGLPCLRIDGQFLGSSTGAPATSWSSSPRSGSNSSWMPGGRTRSPRPAGGSGNGRPSAPPGGGAGPRCSRRPSPSSPRSHRRRRGVGERVRGLPARRLGVPHRSRGREHDGVLRRQPPAQRRRHRESVEGFVEVPHPALTGSNAPRSFHAS